MKHVESPAKAPDGESLEQAVFNEKDGNMLERLIFEHRGIIVLLCLAITLALGWSARRTSINADFEAVIPNEHPYIVNYLKHRGDLRALGNTLRIVIQADGTSVLDPAYLNTLQNINDEILLIPGVDRSYMQSLWTRGVRWIAVTKNGLDGGSVMPDSYDGSAKSLNELRANILRAGLLGRLVASDWKSTTIIVPLLDYDAQSGVRLDYKMLSARLEQLREKYEHKGVRVRVVGFAKVMGDLIDGLGQIILFFLASIAIATVAVYWFNRCARSTLLVVICSLVAVTWQLGAVRLVGLALDPYSILVPFLVFAIGMSHGAQKMNGVMQDIALGSPRLVAARNTFRRLFMAGLTALVCDAVGFAVLLWVKIPAIHDLALIASMGVAFLIFTNLILLPVLLTYTGVSPQAAARALAQEQDAVDGRKHWLWAWLDRFTNRRWALGALLAAAVLAVVGVKVGARLQIGDLQPGAPELRQESRYNRDNAYVAAHYATSSDVLAVMVSTSAQQCANYDTLTGVADLQARLAAVPGVNSTNSFADLERTMSAAYNEGSLKWMEIIPNQPALNSVITQSPRGLFNEDCDLLTVYVYLNDHKAQTLRGVVDAVSAFAKEHDTPDVKYLLAAGNGGIEAATNSVVKDTNDKMLYGVYAAVILLCLVSFRSLRAVVIAILPLMLTSVLAQALMVWLGMGVKVATLPVVALGVGIGVDYALYILSVTLAQMRSGRSLSDAYYHTLRFTGRVVMLTGFTLAAGVATWIASPIKFQADMGLLLAFMFLWNMLGALVLLPALGSFLLKTKTLSSPAVGRSEASSDKLRRQAQSG